MNILFIVNPIAGKGRTREAIPLIERFCKSRNIQYKIHETACAGDATSIVRRESQKGYSGVVSVGGDGTLLEVANGLIGSSLPVGIIPLGSGNDFARAINVPSGFDHIEDALKIIAEHSASEVDLVSYNGSVYLNIASIGFDADIIRDLHKVRRFIKGSATYPVSVFLKFLTYKPKNVTLIIDGAKIKTRSFLTAICNGICYGGGMKVNPNGSVIDGFLDIIHIHPVPRYKIPLLLLKFMRGEHLNFPFVTTYRCKEIEILSEEPLAVNVDGECKTTTPVKFHMMPLSINVFGNI